ncbi:hypothetical protein BHM03_00053470, partial [Ensete ventricosum]
MGRLRAVAALVASGSPARCRDPRSPSGDYRPRMGRRSAPSPPTGRPRAVAALAASGSPARCRHPRNPAGDCRPHAGRRNVSPRWERDRGD